MEKIYMNRRTGEITESHKDAMEWFRAGDEVEIWVNGRMACDWTR